MSRYSKKHTKRLRQGLKNGLLSPGQVLDLLKKNADPNQLDIAIEYDDSLLLKTLIEFGADPNRPYGELFRKFPPLDICIKTDRLKCLKILLDCPSTRLKRVFAGHASSAGVVNGFSLPYTEHAEALGKIEAAKLIQAEKEKRDTYRKVSPLLHKKSSGPNPPFKI